MITFITGLAILLFGYIFYSKYVEKQFCPDNRETPAIKNADGVDFVPLSTTKNILIHLLNIAGLGPILGAIQGILFGPISFILIPLGCIFMGGVHDYFCGMISMRNNGAQITDLIKKYLGQNYFKIFIVIVSVMLLLLSTVFIYTAGDIIADRFLGQTDFSLTNPVMLTLYLIITAYFILATLFPIDKIIGKFYPIFTTLLLLGTLFVVVGFITKGVHLQELTTNTLNTHPKGASILPMFFMTVSCGLLSGFHSTQSTIVSRTITSELLGKKIFYGMMCVESLIAMVWAAGAMHVYTMNIIPNELIGTVNVINDIADTFVPHMLTFIVTLAVVILPITSGDTALRSLRMTIADTINLKQNIAINRIKIIVPITFLLFGILYWAKTNSDSFTQIWRYFNFGNQLIAIPTLLYTTVYLYLNKKNYFIALIPALFYIYITSTFILNAQIGFNLPYLTSQIIGILIMLGSIFYIRRKIKKNKENLT